MWQDLTMNGITLAIVLIALIIMWVYDRAKLGRRGKLARLKLKGTAEDKTEKMA